MRRFHLFEFGDQAWLPGVLRDAGTAYLDTLSRVMGLHRRMAPVVAAALKDSGADRVIDLGTGSGRTIVQIRSCLATPAPSLVLSDKYANGPALEALAGDGVTARTDSIDARAVPAELSGLRTMINAFHHFRPDDARRILADAVDQRMPIVILEASERSWINVLCSPLIVVLVLLLMPCVRPWRWQFALWTYLIPLVPLMTFWDGLVSHLRTYTEDEIQGLTAGLADGEFVWEVNRMALGGGLWATSLTGRIRE